MTTARRLSMACALVGTLLGSPVVARGQCAMCRTALESSEEGRAMAEKLNLGILVLLGAPGTVVASIGAAMARSRRRRESRIVSP